MTGNGRRTKAQVRPGKAGAVALIVMPLLFLAFGIVLFSTVLDTADEEWPVIAMFAVVWCGTMLMLLGYGIHALVSGKPAAVLEIDSVSDWDPHSSSGSGDDGSSGAQ